MPVKTILFLLTILSAILNLTVSQLLALDPRTELDSFIIDNWDTSKNLPANRVNRLIQSSGGYIWLATSNGAVRFDGVQFTVFNKQKYKAITSNYIFDIFESKNRNLWLSTDSGFTRLEDGKLTSIFAKNETGDFSIWVSIEDSRGDLWLGMNGSGLKRVRGNHVTTYTTNDGLTGNFVRALCEDRSGALWIGTRTGLNRLKDGKITPFREKDGLPHMFIKTVIRDSKGNIWIGTYGGGICRFDNGKFIVTDTSHGLPNNAIRAIYEDSAGTLWIGSRKGLTRWVNGVFSSTLLDDSSPYTLVSTICEDSENNLWVGTHAKGLFRIRTRLIESFTKKEGLSNNVALCIFKDSRGTLWAGMRDGLFRRDKKRFARVNTPDNLLEYGVNTITEDKKGFIWIGTESEGVKKLERKGKNGILIEKTYNTKIGLASDTIRCLYRDRDDSIWVGTYDGGLSHIKNNNIQTWTKYHGLPNNFIRKITRDRRGRLWLGTQRGLVRFDGGKFKVFTQEDGLSGNEISTVFEDSEGVLWIGTFENGLTRFKDGKFSRFTTGGGLHDNGIYSILEDSRGYFWIGSKNGIFSVSREELNDLAAGRVNTVSCRAYDENDGMATRQCKGDTTQPGAVIANDGTFWFLTTRGVVMLDPMKLKKNSILPPAKIEGLIVDNNTIDISKKISFAPGIMNLTFSYTALSLDSPEKIRFRYRLDGLDKSWQDAGTRRTAYYTNLPAGDYVFRIIACNRDGVWNHKDDALAFTLRPYFYRTWWFYVSCIVVLLLTTGGIFQFRVRQLKRNKERLEQLVAERTFQLEKSNRGLSLANRELKRQREAAEAANRSKSEFLARMSHEIRTPMNGVIGFTQILMETELSEQQRYYAGTISRSGEALLQLINDILDFSRIEAGELIFVPVDFDPEFIAYEVCEIVYPRLEGKTVEIICHIGDNVPLFVKSDAGRFRQVLINLVGNATKFTETGQIDIFLNAEPVDRQRIKMHVRVKDTGIGIEAGKLAGIFDVFRQADGSITRKYGGTGLGLSICKQIAILMGGDVWAESVPGEGSTFHFTAVMEISDEKPVDDLPFEGLEGKHVLLIEDNLANQEILTQSLNRCGMRVKCKNNAGEAPGIIKEYYEAGEPFDLCIVDVHFPRTDEFDAAKKIRNLPTPLCRLPLLAISATIIPQSENFKASGFNEFLPKPVYRKKLLKAIMQLLVYDENENAANDKKETASRHTTAGKDNHTIHILVAEDHPVNRQLVNYVLSNYGYRLTLVENGMEAVEAFVSNPGAYDLILMDIQMPKMDGREATKEIRRIEHSRPGGPGKSRIPVIAVTAASMKGDREKCIEAGMNDYISKPVRSEVVVEMIKKWIPGDD